MTRTKKQADDGVTLVELMVAMLVLGILMAGLVSVAISTLQVTRVNDARSVATNLAQTEIERLRALPFDDLPTGRVERSVQEDGATYDIVLDATWVDLETDTDPCSQDGLTGSSVVRVDIEVSRADVTRHTVRSSTTISPPPAAADASVGLLTVLVTDHQDPPAPVPNVHLSVTGPTETSGQVRLEVTPTTGCVLFKDLPPGSYDVQLDRIGFVSMSGSTQPMRTAGVQAGIRTAMEFSYAPAGELALDVAVRDGADALLPQDVSVVISRNELIHVHAVGATIDPIWPGLWELWAGRCPDADPRGLDPEGAAYWPGAERQPRVSVPASGSAEGVAELAVVRMPLTGAITAPPDPQPVVITALHDNDDGCGVDPDDPSEPLPPETLAFEPVIPTMLTGGQGQIDLALPYGEWELTATNESGQSITLSAVVDPLHQGVTIATPDKPDPGQGP